MNPKQPPTAPLPPANMDAEESLLGALMLTPFGRSDDAVEQACDEVDPADFFRESHGLIFRAAKRVREAGTSPDAVTVAEQLDRDGDLERAGGKERIHELAALVPAASNAVHHARAVRRASVLRRLILTGERVARLGWEGNGEPESLVEEAERAVLELGREDRREVASLRDTVPEAMARVRELHDRGSAVVGLPTGWEVIDRLTSGLHPGNLVAVGGRPAMGKSSFAYSLLRHTVVQLSLPALLFTMETNRSEVTQRMLALDAFVDLSRVRNGQLSREEWRRLQDASERLYAAPMFVEDAPLITPGEIRSRSRRVARQRPDLALVVVDYLQLTHTEGNVERREREVALASRQFKALAAELNLPVVVLSQLSRQVEGRHDKRPMLSDLRESGAIEQDADLVLLLYRHEYYFPESEDERGIAEVDVAKQRNGPTGLAKLAFVERYARFSDLPADALAAL